MFIRAKQQVLILIAAGVLVAGFIVFRYLPLHRKTAALRQQHCSHSAVINQLQVKQSQLRELQAQLTELESRLADFDAKIPSGTQLGEFLGTVAGLMDEHNLTEQNISPQKAISAGELICVPVTMKCSGRLEQIRKFYESLQKLDRLVRVEKFQLVNDPAFSGRLRMETGAVIYRRKTADDV